MMRGHFYIFVFTCFLLSTELTHHSFAYAQKATNKVDKNGESAGKKVELRRGKGRSDIDFEDIDITAQAKTPFGSLLSNRDPEIPNGFVALRKDFHDRMVLNLSDLK